ncbi:hypothetical protein B0T26DRAFT_715961 [Lasiosphaeria miniovina]|uniref:Uncharacterized protein n=1 Tax=Lasiosphaeria miniovina TaxID=1954250 RepID=A0AA40ABU8_9PEZI|nr:uncharacterized protein B0T26DRAFT_715961 [Lasiosphaeria miniovina]KAK0713018.1 hypothetical protein B0T26DRAFT_715961 [Lasiosphaeria miniovina]
MQPSSTGRGWRDVRNGLWVEILHTGCLNGRVGRKWHAEFVATSAGASRQKKPPQDNPPRKEMGGKEGTRTWRTARAFL